MTKDDVKGRDQRDHGRVCRCTGALSFLALADSWGPWFKTHRNTAHHIPGRINSVETQSITECGPSIAATSFQMDLTSLLVTLYFSTWPLQTGVYGGVNGGVRLEGESMALIAFNDAGWSHSTAGHWVAAGNVLEQTSGARGQATRFYRQVPWNSFDVRFTGIVLSEHGPGNRGGELKLVYSDADVGDDFRVDLFSSHRIARLTAGGLQIHAPLVFAVGQRLDVRAWCDGYRLSVSVNGIPVFAEYGIGKMFNGWVGVGTYEATARFESFDAEEYHPREKRDDISNLKASISSFESQHPYASSAFVMMRFDDRLPILRDIFKILKDELKSYGLEAIRADKYRYHPDLLSNIKVLMNGCRYGIAVLETLGMGDQRSWRNRFLRPPGRPVASNPNIAFEIGYMIRSGKDVLLLKEQQSSIQSDLIGRIWDPFSKDDLDTVRECVKNWCERFLHLNRQE